MSRDRQLLPLVAGVFRFSAETAEATR